jgi:hypothetical protein
MRRQSGVEGRGDSSKAPTVPDGTVTGASAHPTLPPVSDLTRHPDPDAPAGRTPSPTATPRPTPKPAPKPSVTPRLSGTPKPTATAAATPTEATTASPADATPAP